MHDRDRVDGIVPDRHSGGFETRLPLRPLDHVHRVHVDLHPRLLPVVLTDPLGRAHLSPAGNWSPYVRKRKCKWCGATDGSRLALGDPVVDGRVDGHRGALALRARANAGGAGAGLRAHGSRQGARRGPRGLRPRPAQRAPAVRDHVRLALAGSDQRLGDFRADLRLAGPGLLGYEAILARDFPLILTLNFMAAALTLLG